MDLVEGVISPGGVGYDINCGVRLIGTNLTEKDLSKRGIKEVVDELFKTIPSGVGKTGSIRLTKSSLDELLVEGVKWTIENGYGRKEDAEVCEEGGKMIGPDSRSVSETARSVDAPN